MKTSLFQGIVLHLGDAQHKELLLTQAISIPNLNLSFNSNGESRFGCSKVKKGRVNYEISAVLK